jgi:hypothetical protein
MKVLITDFFLFSLIHEIQTHFKGEKSNKSVYLCPVESTINKMKLGVIFLYFFYSGASLKQYLLQN